MLKKVKSKKIKGYSVGGYAMPENTTRPGPLFADQMTTYNAHKKGFINTSGKGKS
jgi:hypothetical protein